MAYPFRHRREQIPRGNAVQWSDPDFEAKRKSLNEDRFYDRRGLTAKGFAEMRAGAKRARRRARNRGEL